jgi:hypothetical protein
MRFYEDRALTRRYGEQARQAALSFDRRVLVARYADVFRSLARPAAATAGVGAEPGA